MQWKLISTDTARYKENVVKFRTRYNAPCIGEWKSFLALDQGKNEDLV